MGRASWPHEAALWVAVRRRSSSRGSRGGGLFLTWIRRQRPSPHGFDGSVGPPPRRRQQVDPPGFSFLIFYLIK
jgi:hypothetical protein